MPLSICSKQRSIWDRLIHDISCGSGGLTKHWATAQSAVPYLQEGYTLAQTSGDTEAFNAIQDNLRECQISVPGDNLTPEPTPTAVPQRLIPAT